MFYHTQLTEDDETFSNDNWFRLHGTNRKKVHRILARITDYVETQSGKASRYLDYFKRGSYCYEIEHIWAEHPERHENDFDHEYDFQEYRNFIGGLLLLPKRDNASYGDLPYAEKRRYYISQTYLRQVSTSKPTSGIPALSSSLKEVNCHFRLTQNLIERILILDKNFINTSPNKSGIQNGCMMTRYRSEIRDVLNQQNAIY